jgi:integrase/recombinase XerC/integrase/recombinase XerD
MKKDSNNHGKRYTLSELIDYYEVCNRAEGKSPRTVGFYSANLKHFLSYLKKRHLSELVDKIDIRLLREYAICLHKEKKYSGHPYTPEGSGPISVSTVHGHVRTLRAFFNWLVREGIRSEHVARELKPPRLCRKVISTLSDEEIRVILKTFDSSTSNDIRNQTLFMLLLDTGLRIGEVVKLTMDNMNLDQGFMKVLGKGNKERVVPFGSSAQRALQRYLFRFRPKAANPVITNVFLSIAGTPLTENAVKLLFTRLAHISGVSRLHAHLCRHTFATKFLVNGGDVFSLQQILGHSTLEMVRHYVNLASNHVVMQHQKFSPLDRLNLRK